MSEKVLFIGFEGCDQSQRAFEFLNVCGFDTTPVFTENKRGAKLPSFVKEWSGDYLLHFRSYCILKKRLLDRVSKAAINFHPCPPHYPGAGGINWGLYNNDKWSAITVHYMNEKVDNGEIIEVYKVPIFENDTVGTLLPRIHSRQLEVFYDFVGQLATSGDLFLKIKSYDTKPPWGKHIGRMREIDELELIDKDIDKEELEKIIRATHIGKYGPKVILHGHTFRYRKEK